MKISSSSTSSYEPSKFGPAFWFTLHNGSTTYPENPTSVVMYGMQQLLINLPFLIPCVKCREHYFEYIKNINLETVTASKIGLFSFMVDLHNHINAMNGKHQMSLDLAKAIYGYDNPKGSTINITYRS